jgi:hypothetical protein
MGRLTLADLKKATSKFKFEEREVEIPSLGGTLLLRGLSVGGATSLFGDLLDPATGKPRPDADPMDYNARLLAAACVDPELGVDDARALITGMPLAEWAPIATQVTQLAGMGDDDREEVRAAAEEFPGSED